MDFRIGQLWILVEGSSLWIILRTSSMGSWLEPEAAAWKKCLLVLKRGGILFLEDNVCLIHFHIIFALS